MPKPDAEIERALAVAAHPDDIDFGCAGTVATWVDAGVEVTYLLITRGDQGGFDDTPREQMASLREAEQRAAAKAVGVTDVRFLDGYRDGWVEPTRELERDIARVIRQVRPQRMIIQSPERNYQRLPASHSDHLASGEAAIRAIYPTARNPFAWPEMLADEGLEPWIVNEVFIAGHPAADHAVDVTGTFDRKVAALREHRSQTGHMTELEPLLRDWATRNAALGGLADGRLAETYLVSELT